MERNGSRLLLSALHLCTAHMRTDMYTAHEGQYYWLGLFFLLFIFQFYLRKKKTLLFASGGVWFSFSGFFFCWFLFCFLYVLCLEKLANLLKSFGQLAKDTCWFLSFCYLYMGTAEAVRPVHSQLACVCGYILNIFHFYHREFQSHVF